MRPQQALPELERRVSAVPERRPRGLWKEQERAQPVSPEPALTKRPQNPPRQ